MEDDKHSVPTAMWQTYHHANPKKSQIDGGGGRSNTLLTTRRGNPATSRDLTKKKGIVETDCGKRLARNHMGTLPHLAELPTHPPPHKKHPNHQRWYAKMEAQSEHVHVAYIHVFFARLAPDLYTQSVLVKKVSASELSPKFINRVLLVGMVVYFLLTW